MMKTIQQQLALAVDGSSSQQPAAVKKETRTGFVVSASLRNWGNLGDNATTTCTKMKARERMRMEFRCDNFRNLKRFLIISLASSQF